MSAPALNSVPAPQGLKQAKEMLNNIQLPAPPDELLMEIGKIEGAQFKNAIACCVNKEDGWQEEYAYLNNILFAVSANARKALAQLGFGEVQYQHLIRIGHHEGANFRKHLVNAKQNQQKADMDYLRRVMASYGIGQLNQSQAPQQRPEPEAPRHQPQQNTQRQPSAPRDNVANFPDRRPNPNQNDLDLSDQDNGYLSRHIYGGKNALCFNAGAEKKDGGDKTVNLEAAVSIGDRKYDWKDKISLKLSHQEMMGVYSVLMGWIPSFEGKGHGMQNEKSFSIKIQDHDQYKFFVSVNCKDKPSRSVPINAFDAARIATLLLGQMMKNESGVDVATYIQTIKHFAMLSAKKAS